MPNIDTTTANYINMLVCIFIKIARLHPINDNYMNETTFHLGEIFKPVTKRQR